MKNLTITSTVKLNNGVEMPVFGLGTFQSERGRATQDAVRWALEAGYRLIDTAAIYGNEEDVGLGIRASGIPRKDIFITTKLWNGDQNYDAALRACDGSLKRLGLEVLDLYLIHWPIRGTRAGAWKALLRIYEEGKARAIGVSNYTVRHLDEVLADSPVIPAVNQFELHVFNTRQPLVDACRQHGIQVESYSPLARARKLDHPRIAAIAARCHKTPAQILIRWALEKGYVVIPKSVHRERILENSQVFDYSLTPEDIHILDGLNEDLHTIRPPFMEGEWE
jgi:diketogulonate reductase-like aldo/keto reductase